LRIAKPAKVKRQQSTRRQPGQVVQHRRGRDLVAELIDVGHAHQPKIVGCADRDDGSGQQQSHQQPVELRNRQGVGLPEWRGDEQDRQEERHGRCRCGKSSPPMIVVQIAEAVQPEVVEDHRVKIESDEVTEAESGNRKHESHKREGSHRQHRNGQQRRFEEHVKGRGIDGDGMVAVCKADQRDTTDDDVKDNQAAERQACSGATIICHSQSFFADFAGGTPSGRAG
jgi:hypothetical protein